MKKILFDYNIVKQYFFLHGKWGKEEDQRPYIIEKMHSYTLPM